MRLAALSAFLLGTAALAACHADTPPDSKTPPHAAAPAAPDISYAPPPVDEQNDAQPAEASGPPRSILPPAERQPPQ